MLLPSQLVDPAVGQPGTPALPVPYPRTGQGGEPHLNLPDAITGNPGDQGCGPPGMPLPGPTGCYPYREPLPAPPPGGPPPGPPARGPRPVSCRRRPSGPAPEVHSPAGVMMSVRTVDGRSRDRRLSRSSRSAITVVATPWWDQRQAEHLRRVLRQRQRSLHRRRGPHPRCRPSAPVESIDPQPNAAKITFSVDRQYPVPADVQAAILSPSLVTARSHPARTRVLQGTGMDDGATIRRSAPRFRSSGTISASSWRSSPTRCSPPRPAGQAR